MSTLSVILETEEWKVVVQPSIGDWNALRQTEMFVNLFRKVRLAVKKGMERPCLSHHTTASCRADRAPVTSLKACGLEKAVVSPDGSGVSVHVNLPHTFYNDDCWCLDYWSPVVQNLKEAQKIACVEILTTLLAMQPNIVRIPLKCVDVDPHDLRAEGRKVHHARLLHWADPFESVTVWEQLVTDDSIHVVSATRRRNNG